MLIPASLWLGSTKGNPLFSPRWTYHHNIPNGIMREIHTATDSCNLKLEHSIENKSIHIKAWMSLEASNKFL